MPALLSKISINRSLSKKWNYVRGNNNDNDNDNNCSKTSNNISSCIKAAVVSDTSSDDSDSSGGEDAAERYGYGDAAPDTETKSFPRRLSTRNSIRRRSSICRQKQLLLNEDTDDENLPFHPERAPRRSSVKGSCPTRARAARRRASISTCTANTASASIEKELASGTIQPSQVLEIRVPGRRESIKRRTSITSNEDVNNVRKIQAISQVKGAVDKQELWCQDFEYTQIKKKIRALIEKVDSTGKFDGKEYCTRGLEKYTSNNHVWSMIEEERPSSGPETSTIQYDHDHDHDNDNHDDDTHKLYYSVYDDDEEDVIMGENDDNEYYDYEANNEDYEEDEDDTMNMIEYNMTYNESDDNAFFCQVTTNTDTTRRSRPTNKIGKYRQ